MVQGGARRTGLGVRINSPVLKIIILISLCRDVRQEVRSMGRDIVSRYIFGRVSK